MSIKIKGLVFKNSKGHYFPVFECQVCKKLIQKKGMIFYNKDEGVAAHHECMAAVPNNKKIYIMSEELKYFLFNLLNNIKIKPEQFPYEFE